MLKKLLIAVVVVVAVLAGIVAIQPADFTIQRSASVKAPPSVLFAHVNDFRKWDAWSPWAKLDPAMKTTFEGPATGPGAIYTWNGNNEVGSGRMTLSENKQDELIRIQLEFIKPIAASNLTEFTFKPDGSTTLVTWSMTGKNNFMSKAFNLVMNMDKMVGADFEKGLAQLKSIAEAAPSK